MSFWLLMTMGALGCRRQYCIRKWGSCVFLCILLSLNLTWKQTLLSHRPGLEVIRKQIYMFLIPDSPNSEHRSIQYLSKSWNPVTFNLQSHFFSFILQCGFQSTDPACINIGMWKPLPSIMSPCPLSAPNGASFMEQSRCPLQCCTSVLSLNCWKTFTGNWELPAYCGTAVWGT